MRLRPTSHEPVLKEAQVRHNIPFVDLEAQHRAIAPQIMSAIQNVVASSEFILGGAVAEFEAQFADFIGVPHAIGVSNGGDALKLALAGLDIGPGDEVLVPTYTYIATALAVSATGARPVLIECDPRTYSIDPDAAQASITERTRAIIPVHFAGQPADMTPLLEIADGHGLPVVEDAAQAHGALYRGQRCGSIGIAGCFSFYPSKNLGAWGDAGMITTGDAGLAERIIRHLRDYGQSSKSEHVEKGLNARLDTIQACVLSAKLPRLEDWNRARAAHAEAYMELLRDVPDVNFQERLGTASHIYHLFILESDRRDALRSRLESRGIQTGIHYPKPVHLHDAYHDLDYKLGQFPVSERLSQRVLSLPMYPELTRGQIEEVAEEVRDALSA
jgi:dTDP-4-amino-4,6-dideoxygalactose transaminase